jgi:polysaccharide deacetylase family protein (PEP-CTERM system associated)
MIFSVDVEEWSQSILDNKSTKSDRVLDNTLRLLDLLDEHKHKATFFTLGNIAEHYPELIKKISENGHEIASHGFNHSSIFNLTPKQVKEEVGSSVKLLEDITGKKVIGFRAPNFSIREYLFEWYCEALAVNGLKYDSSLFPMKVIKYGIEKEYSLKIFNEYKIQEHYLSYTKIGNRKIPFFGGDFFRLVPYSITKQLSKQLNQKTGVFYFRPYELDSKELASMKKTNTDIPLKWRLTQFIGRNNVEEKLIKLMKDYDFNSFENTHYSGKSSIVKSNKLEVVVDNIITDKAIVQ